MDLQKQIGKLVRQVGTSKPIKLNLAGIASSAGLDFIMAGIKHSDKVQELNLANCILNDEDLAKICQRLRSPDTPCLQRLKLNGNEFREPWPLIDLLNDTGSNYTHLDISKMAFQVPQSVQMLANSIPNLTDIRELSLCSLDMFGYAPDEQVLPRVNQLITAVSKLSSLRCLDLSKNSFTDTSLLHLFLSLPSLPRLQVLVLSKINLNDLSIFQLCQMLMDMK